MIRYFHLILLAMSVNLFSQKLDLIPYPQKVEIQDGFFDFSSGLMIKGQSKTDNSLYLQKEIKAYLPTDIVRKNNPKMAKTVELKINQSPGSQNDYYRIKVDKNMALLEAKDSRSLFYAIQTFLQLLETSKNQKIQTLLIEDYPKFDYRGMHLDVSRHFFSVDEVKKYLDDLALYKYNKFHWHLTDDQGWRIEIKKYPKLTEVGAWRNGSQIGPYADQKFDDKRYGGYYTQNQIREVVAYAKKLHIDIIPEIEMPGHSVAAIAAYPELSCMKGTFEVSKKWGVEENILCPTENTFQFLENVLDEVIQLFPYQYIHIGGDEAPKTAWKNSQFCQNLIKQLGLKDEHELQSYFISRIEKYLNTKGKQIIGWDEILQGGLAPNATVMSWTGIQGGIEAAKSGHKAIMTPSATNYFDHYQGNPDTEPLAFGGNTPLEKVYQYNPVPNELTEKEAQFIWGTQGNLWTEYIPNFEQVEYMVFPRMMALSEVAWGTAQPDDYKAFEKRVISHFRLLDNKKINYSKAIFEIKSDVTQTKDGKILYQLTNAKNDDIYYTTDGSEPTSFSEKYNAPIEVIRSVSIKSAYIPNAKRQGAINVQDFYTSKSTGKKITLDNPPNDPYTVGGAHSLVNGVRGNPKFFGKDWLGFVNNNCTATIDFGNLTEISKLQFGAIESKGSWVYYPTNAKISVSDNGTDFTEVISINPQKNMDTNGLVTIDFPKQNIRFMKIEIKNIGTIPDGEPGAGNAGWLFVDELSVY